MSNQVILITGASSGFGRDIAETLNRAGHTVFASMRDPDGRNRPAAQALAAQGVKVVELDVTLDASVERAMRSVQEAAGRIDVLVNNAGLASLGVTEAFSADQAKALFDVNVFGLLRVTRAVLPAMRKANRGLVINIGSIVGRLTFPFMGVYGASKFAIEALSDSLRYELSQLGVEVALVQPSAYPTKIFDNIQVPADTGRTAAYGEVGRIPAAMQDNFNAMLSGPEAPDAHDVARAVADLIAQPRGARPARTVVGGSFGADTVNLQTAPVQAEALSALGLAHLGQLA